MPKTTNKKKKETVAEADWSPLPALEAERFADYFKALSDTTRLRIVLFLRHAAGASLVSTEPEAPSVDGDDDAGTDDTAEPPAGAVTVGDIACHLTGSGKVSSNVSHHLKELRHAGLVEMRRRGKHVYCRLNDGAVTALGRLLYGAAPEQVESAEGGESVGRGNSRERRTAAAAAR